MRRPGAVTLISLRKSATELDRLENLLKTATDCYRHAIRSAAQYAVELNPDDVAEFREHLEAMEQRLGAASGDEDYHSAQAAVRGELREYRDQARRRLATLREELAASAAAMAAFAAIVSSNGTGHAENLKSAMGRLERLAESDELAAIRAGIVRSVAEITASVEEINCANQMATAQMQDEIRLLHREMQSKRQALYTDPASGAWNRQKAETRIDELLRQGESFCLLFVVVQNFAAISRRHSRNVAEGTLKALTRRLNNVVGPDAPIGRWTEREFVAFLDIDLTAALALSRDVAKALSGNYSTQESGFAHPVEVQVATVVVDCGAGSDAHAFRKKIAQLTVAVKT